MRHKLLALTAGVLALMGVAAAWQVGPDPRRTAIGVASVPDPFVWTSPTTTSPPTTVPPAPRVRPQRASRASSGPRVAVAPQVFDDATKQRVVNAIYSHSWNAPRMLAIARCESGLNPWARNGKHVGIFQIANATPGLIEEHVALAFRMWQQRGTQPWVQCGG